MKLATHEKPGRRAAETAWPSEELAALGESAERLLGIWARQLEAANGEMSDAVIDLGAQLGEIERLLGVASDRNGGACASLRGALEEVLIALQFHDRISQRLAHVTRSIGAASFRLAQARLRGEVPDVQTVLCELEDSYTCEVERSLHRGLDAHWVQRGGVTFF